ncbi:MAG TPA: VOC family protein [Myxococcota bacterium]
MAKVTGIGGVFFLANHNNKKLAAWYQQHLGVPVQSWGGAAFSWPDDVADDEGATAWHIAAKDSAWFQPSTARFMINYRVDDLTALVAQLEAAGIALLKGIEQHDNGRFAWLLDPEGNKIELWEPQGHNDKHEG